LRREFPCAINPEGAAQMQKKKKQSAPYQWTCCMSACCGFTLWDDGEPERIAMIAFHIKTEHPFDFGLTRTCCPKCDGMTIPVFATLDQLQCKNCGWVFRVSCKGAQSVEAILS
jgi:hypothetical protein